MKRIISVTIAILLLMTVFSFVSIPLVKAGSSPYLTDLFPANQTTGTPTYIPYLVGVIHDDDYDYMDWSVECSNGDSQVGEDVESGSFIFMYFTLGLEHDTNYTIWVNYTDGEYNVNEVFWFVTDSPPSWQEIWTIDDLYNIRYDTPTPDGWYKLMKDLDFQNNSDYVDWTVSKAENTTGEGWQPIGYTNFTSGFIYPMNGIFDGQNHTISNLYISRSGEDYVGLFGFAGGYLGGYGSTVRNLNLIDFNVQGNRYVGGIVGDCYTGTIENCYASGNLIAWRDGGNLVGINRYSSIINNCHASGYMTQPYAGGDESTGGFAGRNEEASLINNSYSTTDVHGDQVGGFIGSNVATITNCYATGNINGGKYLGGFIGCNWGGGSISDSYSTGSVMVTTGDEKMLVGGFAGHSDGSVTRCYATGNVSGGYMEIGGFIGELYGPTNECYSTGNVDGEYIVGGFAGATLGASVLNCYSTGSVTRVSGTEINIAGFCGFNYASIINNCYSIGAVHYNGGDPTDKGFVGDQNTEAPWDDSGNFYDNETSGQISTTGNAVGKNTADMNIIATYSDAGWDIVLYDNYIDETWYIENPSDYPHLGWEYEPAPPGPSPTDTIIVTFEPGGTISILVNQSSWSPSAKLGETEATATNWVKLDNDGDVQVDVVVNASNSSAWTLTTAPAHNQFQLQYGIGVSWTDLTTGQLSFVADLAYDESTDFGLQIFMPTSSSTNAVQTLTITFTATAD